MLRLTLRSLAAHKARFAMTTFAVVLGVGFVVGSFVLADGLRSSFGDLSDEITEGVDLLVRPVSEFGEPLPLDESVVATIGAVDGVQHASGSVIADPNTVLPVKADGTTIATVGPPVLAFSWEPQTEQSPFEVVEGSAPDGPLEFAIDVDAANQHGFVVGGVYELITPSGSLPEVELVATTRFGRNNDTLGAVLMQVSLDEAQRLFGTPGTVDEVSIVLADGFEAEAVAELVAAVLPASGVEVVDNAQLTAEQKADFNEGITIVGNVLLGFAVVSLFVSVFIIYNTFSIVLGQRVRELGLLRALGAESRQVRRSVLGEAVVIGLLAAVVGVGAGIGVAIGLTALFGLLGASLPSWPLILAPRTLVVATVLSVGVTVVSSLAPARAASVVAPIAALRDGVTLDRDRSRARLVVGGGLLSAGLALGTFGLVATPGSTSSLLSLLGLAAVAVFVGVTMVSPVVAGPAARAIGWPLRRLVGQPGRLARENAARNPRRTATTGAALMIGLSLVSAVLVIGDSVKAKFGDLLATAVRADYLIVDQSESSFTPEVEQALADSGLFGPLTGFRYEEVRLGGEVIEISAADIGAIDDLFELEVVSGSVPDTSTDDVIVLHSDRAETLGVGVGDSVPVEFASGYATSLTVAAVYDDASILDDPVVPMHVFDAGSASPMQWWIAASISDGVEVATAEAAVAEMRDRFPQVTIDSSAEFVEQIEASIDSALVVVNVLLALAVIIALIGIANTLALSVHERTRELGLLRAVGMTRRQLRRSVRWEAAIVAAFGALLGVVVGLVFGWGTVAALPSEFAEEVRVPLGRIAVTVVVSTLLSLVAALLPARRAGRLDVLDAISH